MIGKCSFRNAFMASACLTALVATAQTVSLDGYGPVRFGMSVSEAEKALGISLISETNDPAMEAECMFVRAEKGHEGVSFMVRQKKTIVRVDVDSGTVKTVSGAGNDFPASSLRLLYPSLEESEGNNGEKLVTLWRSDKKTGLRFYIDDQSKKVINYWAGFKKYVELSEGCS